MPPAVAIQKARGARPGKERILVEFSANLLQHADEVARKMNISRSEFIRNAVERRLQEIETKRFEQELAEAYTANAEVNLAIVEEFAHVDGEAF